MTVKFSYALALTIGFMSTSSWAVNKCTDPQGRVTYQEKECPGQGSKLDIKESSEGFNGDSGSYYGGGYSGRSGSRGSGIVHTGPRGGQYTVSPSGNKNYVPRSRR